MSIPSLQDIFQLKCLIENVDIKFSARIENGVKQLIALITHDGDIVLHYTYGELPAVVKRIPWLTETVKAIQAICFDPSATWLLVVSYDGSLFIIPALSLVDKKQKVDCKWSVNDVTHFTKNQNTPDSKPQCVVWWQTSDCNQNALVGYENGTIGLISLTDGRFLGSCTINEPVSHLHLCQDNGLDSTFLLINGKNGQQWRLLLEHHATSYLWPPDTNNTSDDSTKSRLYNLKQMGVDKLASLKQRIVDSKHSRRNSQASDTASDSSHSESSHSAPELLPHLCDTYFSAQQARNRYLFCAFYKPNSLLTVHAVDVETAPLYVHKLPPRTECLLLTDKLIYAVDDNGTTISIVSSQLSESRTEGDAEFNPESLIGQFCIENENEKIQRIYKVTDTTIIKSKNHEHRKERTYSLPKTVNELNIPKMKIDTCVIVTNNSVYKVIISCSPIKKFIVTVNEDWNLIKAERLSVVFGLNLQQLLESCGDILIANSSFHQGLVLYKQAKVHLLKRVLKLAVSADCKALLKFVNLCLGASKVDMSMATKIHIGNLAVMAHTEMVLRHPGYLRLMYTKDFMTFLCYEEYYDQVLAVNVACQAGHWNVVILLAKCRGLQPEVVAAISQVIQSSHTIRESVGEFLYALTEPSLAQSLLIYPSCGGPILNYVRNHVSEFRLEILKRLFVQLDPSQPCAVSLVSKIFQHDKSSSGFDSTMDSIDFEHCSYNSTHVKEFLETFMLVVIHLVEKSGDKSYNINLLEKINKLEPQIEFVDIKKMPPLRPLSCGYEHAAVVRNNSVYTMGLASSGCLGLGPLLTQSSSPKIVSTLADLKIKVLSASCGRKHTLALTDHGVYAWGSNSYGQLGLGSLVQETPYPQLISALFDKNIIEAITGQYHSLALASNGQVYSWGWGIHGQLGHGTCNNEFVPKLLNFQLPIMQIAAGHAHTLILSTEGKIYGFGSNCFGQLGSCNVDSSKTTTPIWVLIMPDIYTPIDRISTAYFHNVAVRADQEVYTWGANPQEVRICQSKFSQKLNVYGSKIYEPWKASLKIYSSNIQKPIEDVSVGYRHSALLHNGKLLWGRSRDGELCEPKLRDHEVPGHGQRFAQISCGPDYIMAIENNGRVLAWGSNNMAQTILGKPYEEHRQPDGKVVLMKNTKRIIKIPSNVPANSEGYPIEIPGLPTMAITYNITDQRSIANRSQAFYAIRTIENTPPFDINIKPMSKGSFNPSFVDEIPKIQVGQKTLHYVLETYFGYYDTETVLSKCLSLNNHQAASKLALLDGHYGDSLNYQLSAFKTYMNTFPLDLDIYPKPNEYDINILGDLCTKNDKLDFNGIKFEFNTLNSPAHILSTSSSLDSIRQWGDDLDHQGGLESPCEVGDMGDIKQSMTQYVQSIKNENTIPITSVSKIIEKPNSNYDKAASAIEYEIDLLFKDMKTKEIIKTSAFLIEFYIKKTYITENHILMQNILLKCIEFWLNNNLPVSVLEMVLLKNMDKYFYPLSILLFCKNFNNNLGEDYVQNGTLHRPSSAGFLKEFSTKFCLQLCSMVLENVNKT